MNTLAAPHLTCHRPCSTQPCHCGGRALPFHARCCRQVLCAAQVGTPNKAAHHHMSIYCCEQRVRGLALSRTHAPHPHHSALRPPLALPPSSLRPSTHFQRTQSTAPPSARQLILYLYYTAPTQSATHHHHPLLPTPLLPLSPPPPPTWQGVGVHKVQQDAEHRRLDVLDLRPGTAAGRREAGRHGAG